MLPFFRGEVEDFSIEETISPDYWFPDGDEQEGVWEWKNDIIVDGDCAYGKFYRSKACFVSMEWFPHLVNLRRSAYQPTAAEQQMLEAVQQSGSLLSRELKKMFGKRGFDSAITHLQMGCYLVSGGFEYNYTRDGRRYGWSVARYCTPEDFFGPERLQAGCPPKESADRLLAHMRQLLPQASEEQLHRIVWF